MALLENLLNYIYRYILKVLIVDNYDSFTFNLYHYVKQFTFDVSVLKNDEIKLSKLNKFDKIILSPGPGLPCEHKNLDNIIKASINKPMLGVCLGHQAIAQYFGAKLSNLSTVNHGISEPISIIKDDYFFNDVPKKIKVGLYHSWIVNTDNFPDCFEITSINNYGNISSYRHNDYDIRGVQFHPESILTEYGLKMIGNWIRN